MNRKMSHNLSFSSSEDLLNDSEIETPTEPSPLMLVSELRGSLTGLDRAVKTYSFLPSEDNIPFIQVDPSSPTLTRSNLFPEDSIENEEEESSPKVNGTYDHDQEAFSWEADEEYVNNYPRGDMDNFATGILDTFDSNLLKLRTQSLPDVFSAISLYGAASGSTDTSPLSSNSTSTVSIVESTKDSSILDSPRKSSYSPSYQPNGKISHSPVLLNGHVKTNSYDLTLEGKSTTTEKEDLLANTSRDKRMNSIDSTATFESRSSPGDSEREEVSVSPLPTYVERRYMQNELRSSAGDLHRTNSEMNQTTTGVALRPKRTSSSKVEDQQRYIPHV